METDELLHSPHLAQTERKKSPPESYKHRYSSTTTNFFELTGIWYSVIQRDEDQDREGRRKYFFFINSLKKICTETVFLLSLLFQEVWPNSNLYLVSAVSHTQYQVHAVKNKNDPFEHRTRDFSVYFFFRPLN